MSLAETKERFGYQWTKFAYSTPEFEQHFLDLIAPLTSLDFTGRTVLDAGCGYGRYALYAARYGASVVGMDFSKAIGVAKQFTHNAEVRLVCGNILSPPFNSRFDIVMAIGVLHHLPDPLQGFEKLVRCVRPGGRIVIWVYSAKRKISNAVIERLRSMAHRLSHKALYRLTFSLALPDFLLAKSSLVVKWLGGDALWVHLIPSHFRLYSRFPFRVSWADWFDRLGAPVRHYFDQEELEDWLARIGAVSGTVVATGDFGWTLIAQLSAVPEESPTIVV